MAAAIARLIAFEVGVFVEMIRRVGLVAALRQLAFIAVFDIEMAVYLAVEVARAMKPRTRANERTAGEPFRAVVAVGSAGIRRSP